MVWSWRSHHLLPTSLISSSSPHLPFLLFLPSFLICIIVSIFWFRKLSCSSHKLPPSPHSLPILGHLHLLGNLPHHSLYKLFQIHGPLISLRLGSVPYIVASTPEMASQILHTHDLAFASRPRTAASFYCAFDSTDIGFAPYGPYWRLMRQLCVTDLFSNKRIEAFRPVREDEVKLLIRSLMVDSNEGRVIPVLSRISSTTNNTIARMSLGKRSSEIASGSQDATVNILNILNEMVSLSGVFNIGDFIPYLQWMDLQGYLRRMKAVAQKYKSIFQQLIDARRDLRKLDSSSPQDLLDVLLSVSQENKQGLRITDDNIMAVLGDMFAAGTDTSSITTQWALAELLKHPTIMKKLQAELDSVAGKERLVQEADLASLPYLRAIVKETFRLHPPLPLLVPHESTKPCQIAGYDIPAKTRAFVNVWAIGRDPNSWEKPLEFWPERFLESDIDVRGQHFQLLPFGTGRRGCPGWMLGLLNVQLVLASVVHAFEWRLPRLADGSSRMELDMSERFGLTVMMDKPLQAMAAPRLPLHLYGTVP